MSAITTRIARACHVPGCPELNCAKHGQRAKRRAIDQHRGSARERGYDTRWDKARHAYLQRHPLCTAAAREGRIEAASVVDHITPHHGDRVLFWDVQNWQSLSATAHARKTMRENGLVECTKHGEAQANVQGRAVCRDCGRPA